MKLLDLISYNFFIKNNRNFIKIKYLQHSKHKKNVKRKNTQNTNKNYPFQFKNLSVSESSKKNILYGYLLII